MHKKRVLITGATGFVGNRLAERLTLSGNYDVSVLIHRYSGPGLARIARLPVDLIQADVLDWQGLQQIPDCDVIVHMAYGTSGSDDERKRTTIDGTENLLKIALQKKVKKFVHFSTAAVHGTNPPGPLVKESDSFVSNGDEYATSKIEAEHIVNRYNQENGLPTVIFRPPLVYGPFGAFWTTRLIKEIMQGAILVNGGTGAANLIFVDNLIDAVLLGIEKNNGDGEAFFVLDDEELTWRDVFEGYATLLSQHPPLNHMSVEDIAVARKGDYPNDLKSWVVTPMLLAPHILKNSFKSEPIRHQMMEVPWLRFFKNRLSRDSLTNLKYGKKEKVHEPAVQQEKAPIKLPSDDLIQLYASNLRFSNEKLKKAYGFEPKISFGAALGLIGDWAKYQGLIN